MSYESMKEALEAILAIEKDSPAAFRAALLLAQEGLEDEDEDEAVAVGCNATGADALA